MEYTVQLENFSGPLDLLLYLIKQEELEIHQISLTSVCDKYLAHIRTMKDLDVNVSAEFLVVAATLMVIKSRALLPHEEEVDLDEELDPEDELIQQLLEYKKFKMASRDLVEMADLRSRVFPFIPPRAEKSDEEIPLEDIDVIDLVRAFAKILSETRLDRMPRLIRSEKALREYIEEVFTILKRERKLKFVDLFADTRSRETVIGRFVAILELAKRGRLKVVQGTCYDAIELEIGDDRELSETEMLAMESDLAAPPPQEIEESTTTLVPTRSVEAARESADAEDLALEEAAEAEELEKSQGYLEALRKSAQERARSQEQNGELEASAGESN